MNSDFVSVIIWLCFSSFEKWIRESVFLQICFLSNIIFSPARNGIQYFIYYISFFFIFFIFLNKLYSCLRERGRKCCCLIRNFFDFVLFYRRWWNWWWCYSIHSYGSFLWYCVLHYIHEWNYWIKILYYIPFLLLRSVSKLCKLFIICTNMSMI
jgi:hypothetical protein